MEEYTPKHSDAENESTMTQEDAVQEYKKYKTANTEEDALYLIKAGAPINTEAHTITRSNLSSGKIKFLIDERVAK